MSAAAAAEAVGYVATSAAVIASAGSFLWRRARESGAQDARQTQVVDRLDRIEHLLVANGGQNNPPTIPDKIAGLRETFTERFDRIDARLERGDERMSGLDKRITNVENARVPQSRVAPDLFG